MLFWICLAAFVISVVCFIVSLEKDWNFLLVVFTASMAFFANIVILTVLNICIG